ncbi:MAG: cytochrome [Bacteroidetes bacterium]|nr:cytochrome [Bacteroidota bacterium]
MGKVIIGVMGPGEAATPEDIENSYQMGKLIASKGWVTLSGGRNQGVMEAVSRGASQGGGLTIGISPSSNDKNLSDFIDIPILTGMGSARNNINVLTAQVVVVCGMGAGTLSEAALAIKANKNLIILNWDEESILFIKKLGGSLIHKAEDPNSVLSIIEKILSSWDLEIN